MKKVMLDASSTYIYIYCCARWPVRVWMVYGVCSMLYVHTHTQRVVIYFLYSHSYCYYQMEMDNAYTLHVNRWLFDGTVAVADAVAAAAAVSGIIKFFETNLDGCVCVCYGDIDIVHGRAHTHTSTHTPI